MSTGMAARTLARTCTDRKEAALTDPAAIGNKFWAISPRELRPALVDISVLPLASQEETALCGSV